MTGHVLQNLYHLLFIQNHFLTESYRKQSILSLLFIVGASQYSTEIGSNSNDKNVSLSPENQLSKSTNASFAKYESGKNIL